MLRALVNFKVTGMLKKTSALNYSRLTFCASLGFRYFRTKCLRIYRDYTKMIIKYEDIQAMTVTLVHLRVNGHTLEVFHSQNAEGVGLLFQAFCLAS